MSTEESKPFLTPPPSSPPLHSSSNPRKLTWPSTPTLLLHLTLLTIYTTTTLLMILTHPHCNLTNLPPSPLHPLPLTYTATVFKNLSGNPFAGAPSPAVDAAWDALLAPVNMRVTREELARMGGSSVRLVEGGGYLAWLGAFHELHCIKMLRQWNYREYYHADITAEEEVHWAAHADHCFEMLRQAAVCHADVSLTTFVWNEKRAKPMFDASESRHTCVDWEALMASTASRVVSDEEIGRLVNPLMETTL